MNPRSRPAQLAVFAVVLAWAMYTGVVSTAYFYSSLPKYRAETAWFVLAVVVGLATLVTSDRAPQSFGTKQVRPPDLILALVGSVGLSALLYGGTCSLGLLSDDFVLLSKAAKHEFWGQLQFFRPVPLMIWAVVQHFDRSPAPLLHVMNVVMHAVNGGLVVVLAHRLGFSRAAAGAAGVLFVTFPASVEAVAWTAGIQDVLLTTFCLAFVLACSEGPRTHGGRWRPLVVALAALVLALATKETAVVAPLLAFALWFARRGHRWHWPPAAAGLAIVCAYAIFRFPVIRGTAGFAIRPSAYFLKELLSRSFSSLAVPFTQTELLRFPGLGVAIAWTLLAAVVLATWRWSKNSAAFGRAVGCALWIPLSAAPVYSMFFVSAALQGSRYLYLPACGWVMLIVGILLQEHAGSRLRRAAGLAAIVGLVVVSVWGVRSHIGDWRNAARLRDEILARARQSLAYSSCDVFHFANLPDSTGGAYVFRNGFIEALEGTVWPSKIAVGRGQPACTAEWDGRSFRSPPVTRPGEPRVNQPALPPSARRP